MRKKVRWGRRPHLQRTAEQGKQHTRANKEELLWVELSTMTTKKSTLRVEL
jgi:hypothetical protein